MIKDNNLKHRLHHLLFFYKKTLKQDISEYTKHQCYTKKPFRQNYKQLSFINTVTHPSTVDNLISISHWKCLTINTFFKELFKIPIPYNELDFLDTNNNRWRTIINRLLQSTHSISKTEWICYFPIEHVKTIADAYEFYNQKALAQINKLLAETNSNNIRYSCTQHCSIGYALEIKKYIERNLNERFKKFKEEIILYESKKYNPFHLRFLRLFEYSSNNLLTKHQTNRLFNLKISLTNKFY